MLTLILRCDTLVGYRKSGSSRKAPSKHAWNGKDGCPYLDRIGYPKFEKRHSLHSCNPDKDYGKSNAAASPHLLSPEIMLLIDPNPSHPAKAKKGDTEQEAPKLKVTTCPCHSEGEI